MVTRIELPGLRGYVDDRGRRRGIWVARIAGGWLVEVYDRDSQVVSRRIVPAVDAAPQQFLASDLQL